MALTIDKYSRADIEREYKKALTRLSYYEGSDVLKSSIKVQMKEYRKQLKEYQSGEINKRTANATAKSTINNINNILNQYNKSNKEKIRKENTKAKIESDLFNKAVQSSKTLQSQTIAYARFTGAKDIATANEVLMNIKKAESLLKTKGLNQKLFPATTDLMSYQDYKEYSGDVIAGIRASAIEKVKNGTITLKDYIKGMEALGF